MRRLTLMIVTAVLVGIVGVLMWSNLTGRVSFVITHGVSMQPLYHAGDLIIVTKKDSYQKGDIVAYHVKGVTVLHRIIGGNTIDGFEIKGDNNQSVDPAHPTGSEILGSSAVHITQGGAWLRRAISAPVGAAVLFLVLFSTGQTVRRRRGKRRATVEKASSTAGFAEMVAAVSTPRLRTLAGLIGCLALFALALGALAWSQPKTTSLAVRPSGIRSMTFSYGTTVSPSAAYDGRVVTAPDPVFRKVADTVDVTFAYEGPAGQVMVNADLSTPNGWHSTVKLAGARPITAGSPATVRLDLDALAARATAGAKATGGSANDVSVAVVPTVTSGIGDPFAPALDFQLTPLKLNLRNPDSSLTVQDKAPAATKVNVPQRLQFAGRDLVSVSLARTVAAGTLLAALLAAAAFLLFLRRSPPVPEDEQILRRHGPLLVEVQPMTAPIDRPTIQVTEFGTLARLALRYGLLVLHWRERDGTTYTVYDDAAAYQYRTGTLPNSPVLVIDEEPAHWELQLVLTGANDELTELANRSLFEGELQYAVDNAADVNRLCLMLIDVDDLAGLNEELGREAGDAVLVAIAERLRGVVRPRDLLARLEGDEFGVLFEDVAPWAVDGIAERIMRVTHEPMQLGDHLTQIQVTIGVVQAAPGQNALELMQHGREALVEAKNTLEAHYAWFTDDQSPSHG